jgi:hypothetical protein
LPVLELKTELTKKKLKQMKKVILFAAVAMIGASAFVSCGPSAEEQKKIQDSIDKMLSDGMSKMGTEMMNTTPADTTAKTDTAAVK